MTTLTITHPKICQFYIDNPNVSLEMINLFFIDLFENVSYASRNSSATNDTREFMTEIKKTVTSLKDDIFSMNNHRFETAMTNIQRDYIAELHTLINVDNYDKLASFLDKQNTQLFDKTTNAMFEILPKNNLTLMTHFNNHLADFYAKIRQDTDQLLQIADKDSIREFIQNFELKSSIMINSLQQPICSFILASENRINQHIASINEEHMKELVTIHQKNQEKITNDIGDFLNLIRTPVETISAKCNTTMLGVLTKIYNSAEISMGDTSSAIITLKRMRKQPIFVKSVETEENVSVDDVNQFISLIEDKNVCGIMLSQKSGISNKKDFHIEIYNNCNIVVFIHNADYSSHKIESAVNIIDNLYTKIRQFLVNHSAIGSSDFHIPKELMDTINQEYQTFMSQKNALIELLKENQKRVMTQLDELRFPQLDKFLATKYCAPIQKPGLKCDICKSFTGNNLKALAAHKRGCIRKNVTTNINTSVATVSILSA